MNEEIIKKVSDLIAKELPLTQVKELQAYFSKAEADAKELESSRKSIKEKDEVISKVSSELTSAKALLSQHNDINERRVLLAADQEKLRIERAELELTILKNRLTDKEAVINHIAGWNAILAKNPRAIELFSSSHSESQAGYSTPQGWVQPSPVYRDKNEARETVHTKSDLPTSELKMKSPSDL